MEGPDLVPIAQAAKEYGVARSTLYAHMQDGTLTRHVRKGGAPRVFLDRRELAMLFLPTAEKPKRKGGKK